MAHSQTKTMDSQILQGLACEKNVPILTSILVCLPIMLFGASLGYVIRQQQTKQTSLLEEIISPTSAVANTLVIVFDIIIIIFLTVILVSIALDPEGRGRLYAFICALFIACSLVEINRFLRRIFKRK